MSPNNFSLVHHFSKKENLAYFTGVKIPTFDIEMAAALEMLGKKRMAIHFHQNEITRGSRFDDHKTEKVIEYGRFESVDKIVREIKRIGDDWLILKDHGVLWFGQTVTDFENFVSEILEVKKINLC